MSSKPGLGYNSRMHYTVPTTFGEEDQLCNHIFGRGDGDEISDFAPCEAFLHFGEYNTATAASTMSCSVAGTRARDSSFVKYNHLSSMKQHLPLTALLHVSCSAEPQSSTSSRSRPELECRTSTRLVLTDLRRMLSRLPIKLVGTNTGRKETYLSLGPMTAARASSLLPPQPHPSLLTPLTSSQSSLGSSTPLPAI